MIRHLVSGLSLSCIISMPLAAQAQAYLVDSNLDQLFSVDLATGAATNIASTLNNGLSVPADLTWKGDTSELWTVDLSGGELGTIDTTTGTFTAVHQTGMSGWQGLAWDPGTSLFYLANQNGNSYTLDPAIGTLNLQGPSGFALIAALDIDPSGALMGIDFFTGHMVSVDKNTGVGTNLGTMVTNGFQGLGIASDGTWYGANTNDDSLHTIDPATGTNTLVGANGAGVVFAKGFDVVGGPLQGGGKGCRDATGTEVKVTWTGSPSLGGTLTLDVTTGYTTPTPYFMMIGASNQLWGVTPLPFDLAPLGAGVGCKLYQSADLTVPSATSIGLPIQVPQNTAIVGTVFYAQAALIDPAASALGLVFSNYVRVEVVP